MAFGVALGLPLGFGWWLMNGPVVILVEVLAIALTAGLGIPLVLSPWIRYYITVLIVRRRHTLPSKPALFFDWAYAADR
jgi:hypothetical protein